MKKLKAVFAFATALCFCTGYLSITEQDFPQINFISANAEDIVTSGTCGENLTWNFNQATGMLTISGTGAMYDWNLGNSGNDSTNMPPWFAYYEAITEIMIENGVTTIGKNAFKDCKALLSVTIPDGITTIGNRAFENCKALLSVTIPDSVTTIDGHAF